MPVMRPSSPRKSSTVVELVSWQRWRHLHDLLRRWGDDGDAPVFDDRLKKRLPEEYALHLACQNQAPGRIVEALAARYPDSARRAERVGRHPLHIACARGLRPRTIDFLVRACPDAVGARDEYGKTPLHYACESYAYNYGIQPSNALGSPEKSLHAVVSLLLEQKPHLANVEDEYGMNAIEYALENDADIKIIKLMQNTSRDNWRRMKKSGGGKRHEVLRQSIGSLRSSVSSLSLSSSEMLSQDECDTPRAGIDVPELKSQAKIQAARTA